MTQTRVLALVLAAVLAAPAAAVADGPHCAGAKLRAAARKAAGKLMCHRRAVLRGGTIDPDCLARVEARFVLAFTKAEEGGGCATAMDAATVEAAVDQFVADLVASLPATTTTSTSTSSSSSVQTCGVGGACFGTCPAGQFCVVLPSCVCNGPPPACFCSAVTYTTCTMPVCTTTTLP
jgi:hypothetical protein